MSLTDTHWKANWPWWELCRSFDSKSSKLAKTPMRSTVRLCLLLCCFLHTQGRKAQLFSLLPKADGWLCPAPLYQLWSGLYKEKVRAEMGTSQGPRIPREPRKALQQNPTRVVPIMCQGTAAALACKGTQLRERTCRERIFLLCHTDLL